MSVGKSNINITVVFHSVNKRCQPNSTYIRTVVSVAMGWCPSACSETIIMTNRRRANACREACYTWDETEMTKRVE